MFKVLTYLYLTLLFVIIAISSALAQETLDRYFSKFEAAKLTPQSRVSSDYLLIETAEPFKFSELKQDGINVLRVISPNHYIVSNDVKTHSFQIVYSINNLWKLSDNILFNYRINRELIVKSLSEITDSHITKLGSNLYSIKYDKKLISQLLANENVIYIGSENLSPTVESRVIDMNLNPNKINFVHNARPDLNGEGIVVSIQEQLFDKTDLDLFRRSINSDIESSVQDNHATEMATIIAGAGNTFVTGKGVANAAQITSSDFTSIFPDDPEKFQSLNAFVQNHSYGTEIENFYGALAEAYDQSAVNNPKLLHIFSSGNSGDSTPESGIYAGLEGVANLTGNFKQSKNSLVVASVDTVNNQPAFVSVGPAYDGRVKPELAAYSAVGASNSAALVSGVTALLQQEYNNLFNEYPNASLLKAILINGTDDVGNVGIDFETGYGSLNAKKSVQILSDNQFFEGSVSNSQSVEFPITVPNNVSKMKVTLSWTDPAASVNSSTALVNDLDLSLDLNGEITLPWVLNPNPTSISELPVRGLDRLNTVEQISLDAPVPGDYMIQVDGFDVLNGSQQFSIAYSFEYANSFEWTFPTPIDNMPYNGETTGYFRWETTLTGLGVLEFSVDNGDSWEIIDAQVDLEQQYYRWQPPLIDAQAIARISINNESYSTEVFSISRTLKVDVTFNCADSILISWPKIENATNYSVKSFNEGEYLELYTSVQDTSVVIYKNSLVTKLLAVQPIYNSLPNPLGSQTFDYDLLGTQCYLSSFSGTVDNELVNLNLTLGLNYGVNEVLFERVEGNSVEVVARQQANALVVSAADAAPTDGLNLYRATIEFDNGAKIISDTIGVYYLESSKVLVFPNPLSSEDFLNVLSKDFNGSPIFFELLNRSGQVIYKESLQSESNSLFLPDVTSGIYFYRVITQEGVITERLFILRE